MPDTSIPAMQSTALRPEPRNFQCGRFLFEMQRPLVMGILNVTPDSFSDGGQFSQRDHALRHAEAMLQAGADILDIGGESSRPGAAALPLQEELDRVLPVIEALRDCGKALSIDTYKPEVMRAALALGADMVNDIWALRQAGAVEAVAASQCGVCLMHMQKNPQTMQFEPSYADVVGEVRGFLIERAAQATAAGIAPERIVLDPGFGFGKSLTHNLALLQQFAQLSDAGYFSLAGLSRKSMLGLLTGREPVERVSASVAGALIAVQRGASIVRVHDVAETVDALKVWQAVQNLHDSM